MPGRVRRPGHWSFRGSERHLALVNLLAAGSHPTLTRLQAAPLPVFSDPPLVHLRGVEVAGGPVVRPDCRDDAAMLRPQAQLLDLATPEPLGWEVVPMAGMETGYLPGGHGGGEDVRNLAAPLLVASSGIRGSAALPARLVGAHPLIDNRREHLGGLGAPMLDVPVLLDVF